MLTQGASERALAALAELGRTMVSDVDYEQVLEAVIEKTARIMDSSTGAFMLYDEASGMLVLQKPAFGIDNEPVIAEYRVPLSGGGNAVSVFVTGQPYISNDTPRDPRVLQRYAQLFNAVRILTVPLRVENRSIGVFHCINKRRGDYTREDMELLRLMAPQLAVIIQSAAMMRQLRERERQQERIIGVHNALGEMVLGGGDVGALTERLSQLLSLPVLATEGSGRTAWSTSLPAGLRGPATDGLLAALGRIEAAAELDLTPIVSPLPARRTDLSLMTVPILIGADARGAIAALGEAASLDDFTGRTLQQAALVFALGLAKEREVYEVERRLQADALEHLLVSESDAEAGSLLRRLGLDEGRAYRVASLQLTSPDPQLLLSRRFQTYLSWLHRSAIRELADGVQAAAVVARGQGLVALLPSAEDADPDREGRRLTARLERLMTLARPPASISAVLGVGGVGRRPGELRRSFEEAGMVVAVQRRLGAGGGVLLFEQLGLYRLLARPSGGADLRQFVARTLGPLLDQDRRNGTDWTRFLEALVAANFSVKTAARRIGLHVNTAKYRAARIQALLGVDFGDPDARLDLHLALKIRTLDRASGDRS
jgi:sugar diacid utilization regulator